MIYRNITVRYWTVKGQYPISQIWVDYNTASDATGCDDSLLRERKRIFHMFKNNGKVSKRDCSRYDVVNREAERLLQVLLQAEKESKVGRARAAELARIVNSADFEHAKNWHWIKTKVSHSGWYDTWTGRGSFPSTYNYEVPEEVAKEADELYAIRKKHQGDDTFRFYGCSPTYRVTRLADHPNDEYWDACDQWIEPAEEVTD